jgi:hypothetical protein
MFLTDISQELNLHNRVLAFSNSNPYSVTHTHTHTHTLTYTHTQNNINKPSLVFLGSYMFLGYVLYSTNASLMGLLDLFFFLTFLLFSIF